MRMCHEKISILFHYRCYKLTNLVIVGSPPFADPLDRGHDLPWPSSLLVEEEDSGVCVERKEVVVVRQQEISFCRQYVTISSSSNPSSSRS